jgi:L-methionine (R)-S-oxide reductase
LNDFKAPDVTDRCAAYQALDAGFRAIIAGERNMTLRYATLASLLTETFGPRFFWTGFYLVDPDQPDHLIVGPYQGTMGCLRIPFGKGVCGAVAAGRQTLIVPDVDAFPGHIACDSRSRSEIVVPLIDENGRLHGVLDVDSTVLNAFDAVDREGLERLCASLLDLNL